jgi:hypothetical protein
LQFCFCALYRSLDSANKNSPANFKAILLVFIALPLHPLDFLALAIELRLIAVNLLLLAVIGYLMTLQLVTDQGACAETQSTANRSPSTRVTDGGTNDSTRGGAAKGANASAFFTGAERPAGASRKQKSPSQNRHCRSSRY